MKSMKDNRGREKEEREMASLDDKGIKARNLVVADMYESLLKNHCPASAEAIIAGWMADDWHRGMINALAASTAKRMKV